MSQQHNTKQLNHDFKVYDFMHWNTFAFIFSGLLCITAVIVISVFGFNWGLDFTGGTVIEMTLKRSIDLDILRNLLKKSGLIESQVQNLGSSRNIMVRLSPKCGDIGKELGQKVISIIQKSSGQIATVKCIDFFSPSVGTDLVQTWGAALLIALISILIYISFRFEWRLALGAVLALVHDVIITLGILALFHIEINLTIIASLMSVIGYSLNDTIVILDRIRENFRKMQNGTSYEIINISLTQTLNRTIMTSVTTEIVMLILFIFGGALLNGFSLTMLIGIFIGTISSIYVASSLALKFGIKREHVLQKKVEKEGDDQPSIFL